MIWCDVIWCDRITEECFECLYFLSISINNSPNTTILISLEREPSEVNVWLFTSQFYPILSSSLSPQSLFCNHPYIHGSIYYIKLTWYLTQNEGLLSRFLLQSVLAVYCLLALCEDSFYVTEEFVRHPCTQHTCSLCTVHMTRTNVQRTYVPM